MGLNSASAPSTRPSRRDKPMAGYSIAGHAVERRARPSTILRIERLRALIAELSTRQMDLTQIAGFLRCSPSGTRNYVSELVDATVLIAPDAEAVRNKLYRLSTDLQKIHRFLAGIAAQEVSRGSARIDRRSHSSLADARYLHVLTAGAVSIREAEQLGARRDPLVEALFGQAAKMERLRRNSDDE
jgi:hypothetical protein